MIQQPFDVYFEDGTGLRVHEATALRAALRAMVMRMDAGKNFFIDCVEDENGFVREVKIDLKQI